MKTISRPDADALGSILNRVGYDTGGDPHFGPQWRSALADFGEKAGLNEVAQVESYDVPPIPAKPDASAFFAGIIDLDHDNPFDVLNAISRGVAAAIHKASQGLHFQDELYASRRAIARTAGMLWGAYHFSSGDDGQAQADHFLSIEDGSDPKTLLVLDWENSADGTANMNADNARKFVLRVREKTGRLPMIYGSNLPHENLPTDRGDVLWQCPLWIARVNPEPPTWAPWKLWQFRDDSTLTAGQDGYSASAKAAGWDWNRFAGTADELRAAWPFTEA